jgi:RNA polymerase sigma-70 factor, ECF subfamily
MNDFSLVSQVAVFGNKRAFDELVRKYLSPVRRFLLSLTLGDAQLADDLAQDTFIKAYTCIGTFRALSSFSTWIMRIAYNVYYDYRRSHHETTDVDTPALSARVGTTSTDCSLSIDIIKALALLRPDERTCITLQLIDGQSIDNIAQITGIPKGTVKSHLSRGKEKLANYLKHNGYERQ